jgi:tetratricopeptide (TPR) repeat protein
MMHALLNPKSSATLLSHASEGILDGRLESISSQLNIMQKPRHLKEQESQLLVELLEGWSFKESWEAIVEWSSQAILGGFTFRLASTVYRHWLEALLRSHDLPGAFSLCRHLLSFRRESPEFLALALLGLSKLGRRNLAVRIARSVANIERRSLLMAEALATFNIEFMSRNRRIASLAVLERVAGQKPDSYFSLLNWFESSLELDCHDQAARAVNFISKNFPFAPEPIRTAAHIAMDVGEWTEVVRCFDELLRINPMDHEARVGLAGALEHAGEVLAARRVLEDCSAAVSIDDYDFSATLGHVSFQLYKKYGNPDHRTEAIRSLSNCARIAPRYGIPSATFHAFLHELNAGVGELAIPAVSVGKSQRFWICMANDYGWKRLLVRQSFLIKVPEEAQKGDIVFMCRGQGLEGVGSCKIEGILEILTPQIPDERLERLVKCGNFKMFDAPVKYVFKDPPLLSHDGHGLHNFSSVVELYYAEFSAEAADEVVSKVESLGQGYFAKRLRKYA